MTELREIKKGDRVKIKNENEWLTVNNVRTEIVKTIHKGNLTFQRLYFVEHHRPVWDYEVESVRDETEVD